MFVILEKGLIRLLTGLIPIRSYKVKVRKYFLENTLSFKLDSLKYAQNSLKDSLKQQEQIKEYAIHNLEKRVADVTSLAQNSMEKVTAILETLSIQDNFKKIALKKINYQNKAVLLKYYAVSQVDFLGILNENFNNKRIGGVTNNQKSTHAYNINNYEFKEGDIVLDVGANIGIYSIRLLQHFPFLKIYAFEPILENFELLCENIRLNKLENNIIPINKAVCSHNNGLYMQYLPFYPAGSSANNLLMERRSSLQYYSVLSEESKFVESITLDDFLKEHGIEKVKLIKMDCEGAEKEIIFNTKVLPKFEYFIVELHFSKEENNEIVKYLQKFFPEGRLFVEELNHYQDKG